MLDLKAIRERWSVNYPENDQHHIAKQDITSLLLHIDDLKKTLVEAREALRPFSDKYPMVQEYGPLSPEITKAREAISKIKSQLEGGG